MKKADDIHRLLAKSADLILVIALSSMLYFPGVLIGAFYILISDGLFDGQSLGKKIFKIKTVFFDEDQHAKKAMFKQSVIRNGFLSVLIVFSAIPFLGYLVMFVLVLYLFVEGYFLIMDSKGIRIGDIYAQTQVIDT